MLSELPITMEFGASVGMPCHLKMYCNGNSNSLYYDSWNNNEGDHIHGSIRSDSDAFWELYWLNKQPSPNKERDAIILKLRQHFPNAYALFLKDQLSEGLIGPELDAIVAELKRDYPSLYIECLSEGLIEVEGCDVI